MIQVTQEIVSEASISFALTVAAYDQIGMPKDFATAWMLAFFVEMTECCIVDQLKIYGDQQPFVVTDKIKSSLVDGLLVTMLEKLVHQVDMHYKGYIKTDGTRDQDERFNPTTMMVMWICELVALMLTLMLLGESNVLTIAD